MTNWYHRKLTQLQYNSNVFDDIIGYAKSTTWKHKGSTTGEMWADKNDVLCNVNELDLSVDQFPILQEIFDGLQLEFKRPRFYVSSVPAGGLSNHIDHQKWGNFGFPLVGNFAESPQYYYDPFNHPVEHFVLDTPIIFSTRMLHGVPRSKNSTSARWILMMEIYEWMDHVFKKVDNDTIWKDTKNFKWLTN